MYNEFPLTRKARKFLRLCAGRNAFPPEDITIEVSTLCDLNCSVCFRKSLPLETGFMDLSAFRLVAGRIMDAMGGAPPPYLNLVGLGEPFLNPCFPDILRHIRGTMPGTRVNVSSNLVSAPEKMLAEVFAGGLIDRLSVSIDLPDGGGSGLHAFSPELGNRIKTAAALSAGAGRKLSIRVHTIMLSKEQALKLPRICAGIGVEILHLIRLNTHHLPAPRLKRPTKEEETEIVRLVRAEAKRNGVSVWHNNAYNLFMRAASRFDRVCLLSDDHLFISAQADALPCFFLRGVKFGNLKEQSLREIFSGRSKKRFYTAQRGLCGGCDVYKEHCHH